MDLTVVIPVWREGESLRGTLARLRKEPGVEILLAVADAGTGAGRDGRRGAKSGGAPDAWTEGPAPDGVRVIRTGPPCRGAQLDAGARAATAPALLFLHADCIPPDGFAGAVASTLADRAIVLGSFSLAFDAPGLWYRLLERATSIRCALTGTPYGDQGLFLRREDYLASGGFRAWPFLEDVELVRRLRRIGKVRTLPARMTASARRYRERGPLRTTLRYRFIALLWSLRVPPSVIWSLAPARQAPADRSLPAGR